MVQKLVGCWVLWPIHMKEHKWVRLLAYITGLERTCSAFIRSGLVW